MTSDTPVPDKSEPSTTASSVAAQAVNTLAWLRDQTEVAVPVYQRHYRWDIDRCRRLLDDIRTVGAHPDGPPHFIGSILTARSDADGPTVLIDGQQRITTLMLIMAAIGNIRQAADPPRTGELEPLLAQPGRPGQPKLRLHPRQQPVLANLLFNPERGPFEPGESELADNYEFLLADIDHDPHLVWAGLERLEHVVISLGDGSSPQQVFESLNSTSAPLRDHELVHNYVLMNLPYDHQHQVEARYWQPIEEHTGEFIDQFLRDYLIQRTGRDTHLNSDHGVYEAFKAEFSALSPDTIDHDTNAPEWAESAAVYRDLLDPDNPTVTDPQIRTQLHDINTFGTAMYPIVMATYRDWKHGTIDRTELIDTLDQLQALYLRRMVVGQSRDHLAAQLCRRRTQYGHTQLARDIARRSPSDERVRNALQYRSVPHAGYVLRRLDPTTTDLANLEIEHIFPQTPAVTWTAEPNGPSWSTFPVDEQARYHELTNTLGNLVLLEQPLNAGAGNRPFAEKRDNYYAHSQIASVQELAGLERWDRVAIQQRTAELTDRFVETWPTTTDELADIDVEQLTPILDAQRRPGYYPGWKTELAYAKYRGQLWEVHNHKELYRQVFHELWRSQQDDVLDLYASRAESPIVTTAEPGRQWDALDVTHFLFMGYFPQYALGEAQTVLDELGLADEVFVKYAIDDD